MTILSAFMFLGLGIFGGFMAGLLGVGGGMILVPFISMILAWQKVIPAELAVHAAVATSMSMIMFTSLSSMRAHHKQGAVRWPIVLKLVPGILLGGLLAGGFLFSVINMAWLALIFACFVGYSAYSMLRNKKPKPTRELPGWPGMLAAGTGIGTISGLVGAGGGGGGLLQRLPALGRRKVSQGGAKRV